MSIWRPCFLAQIVVDETRDEQVIFLRERDGARRIPIVIGPLEATAIDRAVKGARFPRPLTHDLLATLLNTLGAHVTAVRIIDLRQGTFYAELVLSTNDGVEHLIDCRPSDAIALLVRLPGVPLLVAETVLSEAGGL